MIVVFTVVWCVRQSFLLFPKTSGRRWTLSLSIVVVVVVVVDDAEDTKIVVAIWLQPVLCNDDYC